VVRKRLQDVLANDFLAFHIGLRHGRSVCFGRYREVPGIVGTADFGSLAGGRQSHLEKGGRGIFVKLIHAPTMAGSKP
jgi:hypothetical protein